MRFIHFGLMALMLMAGTPAAAQTERPDVTRTSATPAPRPDSAPEAQPTVAAQARIGPVTGYPIPRYVTMRADEGNARRGPSRSHRIDWVFTRSDMPMMVVAEYGHWRRVVDRDGAGGWMHYALLSGARSAIVEVDMLPLYARPDTTSTIRAYAEIGVTGGLDECIPGWCLMETGGFSGWVEASALWGVDPGETFD